MTGEIYKKKADSYANPLFLWRTSSVNIKNHMQNELVTLC